MKNENTRGALHGLRVIDLSRVLGGPLASQVLGDHGADVIKVEPPSGDETRQWGPPFRDGTASYFLGVNRNKRAIALDLKKAEGREVLLNLLEDADVLLENFKTGTMSKWGLGYEEVLSKKFPRLIHCRVSGFGSDGPLGGLPGYDAVLQAMCGIMSVNGTPDSGPTRVGLPVVDMVTGLNSAMAIMLALRHRDATGQGQFVEATLFDSALSLLHPHAANYALSGVKPKLTGNDHPNISPYSVYRTGTRPVYLSIGNDRQFHKLCHEIHAPEIAEDVRFIGNGNRVRNRDALAQVLEQALAGQDGMELSARLIRNGIPAAPVLDVEEALHHPHTAHRNMNVKIEEYEGLGAPSHLTVSAATYRRKPPSFSQHTEEVLKEVGYTEMQLQELQSSGVTPSKPQN